jgi:hypothetical protein
MAGKRNAGASRWGFAIRWRAAVVLQGLSPHAQPGNLLLPAIPLGLVVAAAALLAGAARGFGERSAAGGL